MSIDLFGVVIQETTQASPKKKLVANGYPKPPGSGPAGETCKTCEFKHRIQIRSGKGFWKCLKFHSPQTQHQWSGCISSDIRLKSPACSFWEPALSKVPQQPQHSLRQRGIFQLKETK